MKMTCLCKVVFLLIWLPSSSSGALSGFSLAGLGSNPLVVENL